MRRASWMSCLRVGRAACCTRPSHVRLQYADRMYVGGTATAAQEHAIILPGRSLVCSLPCYTAQGAESKHRRSLALCKVTRADVH